MIRRHKLPGSPGDIVAILRSASSAIPDSRIDAVLEFFRQQWLDLARRHYASLQDEVEDAVQSGLVKLVSPSKLEALEDVTRLERWARSIFINTVLDLYRDRGRRQRRQLHVGPSGDEPDESFLDGLPSGGPTPEELASYHERLRIVSRAIAGLEVPRLKFVEDLPDKEIAQRQHI